MKRMTALLMAVLMAALVLLTAGCDRRGRMTEKETQRLYDEFSDLIRSGEIWEYTADTWLTTDWSSEEEKETAVKYLRIAAEKAFDPENQVEVYGSWHGSKEHIQTVYVEWKGSLLPNDEREGVRTLFAATKWNSGRILLSWEDITPDSNVWRTIVEAQFNKEPD